MEAQRKKRRTGERIGFVVSSNNKIAPGSMNRQVGIALPTTARAVRLRSLLKKHIQENRKLGIEHMKAFQQDLYDEYAARLVPKLILIVERHKSKYFAPQSEEVGTLDRLTASLKTWKYEMPIESKNALIYNMWYAELFDSLFKSMLTDEFERESVTSSFFADHFLGNLIFRWANGTDTNDAVCESTASHGRQHRCIYNVLNALLQAHKHIVANLGPREVAFNR